MGSVGVQSVLSWRRPEPGSETRVNWYHQLSPDEESETK